MTAIFILAKYKICGGGLHHNTSLKQEVSSQRNHFFLGALMTRTPSEEKEEVISSKSILSGMV